MSVRDRLRPRPRDPRLARTPDRRGRARALRRHDCLGERPVRRVDRTHEAVELRDGDPSRYRAAACSSAVAAVNGEIADALRGRAGRPARRRPRADRARRHAGQVAPRRQRDPRRLAGLRARRGRRRRACRSGATSRATRAAAAAADGEHHQRRPARGPAARLPGLPGHAGRRRDLPRRAADVVAVYEATADVLRGAGSRC